MPGCDFTRRDLLRWTAVALAAPLVPPRVCAGALLRSPGDDVSPANLELVTLTEDRAVITWYTGYTGSDDGLGRMEPAPADAEVRWGTDPAQPRPDRRRGRSSDTPYHRVELSGLEPGRTYYYQAWSNGKPAPPTPFTLIAGNAVGTIRLRPRDRRPVQLHHSAAARRAGSSSRSCSATTSTWARRRRAWSGGIPGIVGITTGARPPAVPGGDARVARRRRHGARRPVPARRRRHHRRGRAPRPEPGRCSCSTASATVARRLLRDPRQPRPGPQRRRPTPRAASANGRATTASTTSSSRATIRRTSPRPAGPARARHRHLRQAGQRQRRRRAVARPAGVVPRRAGRRTVISRRWCSATTRWWCRTRRSRSRPATRSTPTRPPRSSATTPTMPGMFLHHAGHTHRNKRTVSPRAPPTCVHQEIAAGKEYPGGFSLLRFHTGGYALNFHKSSSDLARRWSERSRQEILGLWPQFALGSSVADRNHGRRTTCPGSNPRRCRRSRPSRARARPFRRPPERAHRPPSPRPRTRPRRWPRR